MHALRGIKERICHFLITLHFLQLHVLLFDISKVRTIFELTKFFKNFFKACIIAPFRLPDVGAWLRGFSGAGAEHNASLT